MIGRRPAAVLLTALALATPSRADDIIVVTRGPDTTVFGSCVPSLIAHNRSRRPVDYVQVDLEFALRDGRTHRQEFKSSYRHGVSRPIAPDAMRPLVVHGDESRPMGAACADIVGIGVVDAICEAEGKPCPTPISVKADR
ncbi:MAG: hypothetical protein FJX20_14560 [Alphaproteobacteria bacterium]|nr:hypothetical protein [Alphaproteobacteria bacterium]